MNWKCYMLFYFRLTLQMTVYKLKKWKFSEGFRSLLVVTVTEAERETRSDIWVNTTPPPPQLLLLLLLPLDFERWFGRLRK